MTCECYEPHQTAQRRAEYSEIRASHYAEERKILLTFICEKCGRTRGHAVYKGSAEWSWAYALMQKQQSERTTADEKEVLVGL